MRWRGLFGSDRRNLPAPVAAFSGRWLSRCAVLLSVLLSGLLSCAALAAADPAAQSAQSPQPDGGPVVVVSHAFPEELFNGIAEATSGWAPFYVELAAVDNRAVEVELVGRVEKSSDDDRPGGIITRRRVQVAPGAPTRTWLYLRYEGENLESLQAKLKVTAPGWSKAVLTQSIHLGADPDEYALPLLVSGEHIKLSLSPWGATSLRLPGGDKVSPRRAAGLEEKQLPDHYLGYGAVRLLVLRNPDEKVMEPEQLEAIRRWVYLGGWVILVPSNDKPELYRGSLLKSLLPGARFSEPQGLAGFVHAEPWIPRGRNQSSADRELPSEASGGTARAPLPYLLFDPLELETEREILANFHAGGDAKGEPDRAVRLYYEAGYGAGTVGVLTFDEQSRQGDSSLGRESLAFCQNLWTLILRRSAQLSPNPWKRLSSLDSRMESKLRAGLTREIGVWAIAGLVAVYLLLVGPTTYLVLKRMGRLSAIVWVEPLVVIVYLGIISVTAYVTKGFLTKVQVVSVIEQHAGDPYAIQLSYLGLFSADESSYRLAAPGADVILPLNDKGSLEIEERPSGQGPALLGSRLAKWATGTYHAWRMREAGSAFGVSLEEEKSEDEGKAAAVTIVNRTPWRIRESYLIDGQGRVRRAGPVPARGKKRCEGDLPEVELAVGAGRPPAEQTDSLPDQAARQLLKALIEGPAVSASRARFIGLLDRDEQDFVIDQPTSLDQRLDFIVVRQ